MPITSSNLVWYGAASNAEDNVSTQGGAVDTTTKISFTDISTTDNVTVISSTSDDATVRITGRLADGSIDTEDLALNGTSRVTGAVNFERILKIELFDTSDLPTETPTTASGTVTVTRDNSPTFTTIATLESGIERVISLFYGISAEASSGNSRSYYQKVFVKNTHGSLSLQSAKIVEFSDPAALITFDLEDAKNGSNSIASRLNTTPSSMLSTFDSSDKNVIGNVLEAGSSQGIWIKAVLAAGLTSSKNTYSLTIEGSST